MKGLLTANVATNLYWLGRYLQRVEATLNQAMKAYDEIIDVDKSAGTSLYKKYGVDLKYTGAQNFLNEAILGSHESNLLNVMANARENAIICRSQIDTEAFGEIIELHAFFENIAKRTTEIDYKFIDSAHSLISEIWGSISKREQRRSSDCFFKLGKLVEEVDLHLRFESNKDIIEMVTNDIYLILDKLSHDESTMKQSQSEEDADIDIMNDINKRIAEIIIG